MPIQSPFFEGMGVLAVPAPGCGRVDDILFF